jgi:erythromycin esterase
MAYSLNAALMDLAKLMQICVQYFKMEGFQVNKCIWRIGIVLMLVMVALLSQARVSATSSGANEYLTVGVHLTDSIGVGEIHRYPVDLDSGSFISIKVNQLSSDVVVTLFNPDSTVLKSADGYGIEILDAEPLKSGRYWVEIVLFEGLPAGSYEIWIDRILTPDENRARLAIEAAQVDSVITLIGQNAINIKTPEAGHGFDDLQPLKKLIGDARIVGLGEATHGTREFFQFKHRMLEFLVEEMGFTAFVIEAIMPECSDINRYVLTGEGDPSKALAGLYFWTWDTQEVLALIEWMRAYNADPNHKRKIKFYGDDMQMSGRAAKKTLAFLQQVDSEQAQCFAESMSLCLNPFTESYLSTKTSAERRKRLLNYSENVLKMIDKNKTLYTAATSPGEYSLSHRHASVLVQFLRMICDDAMASSFIRDSSMAENTRWILNEEGEQGRLVLWAHNYHISNDSLSQGWHLKKIFGNEYRTIGMIFNRGSFQAKETFGNIAVPLPLNWFTVPPLDRGTPARAFADADLKLAVLGLSDLKPNHLLRRWFSDPRPTYFYGAVYSDSLTGFSPISCALAKQFDALYFVENTTAARANPNVIIGRAEPVQPILSNGDFEVYTPDSLPQCWRIFRLSQFDYSANVTRSNPNSGNQCLLLERKPGYHYGEVSGSVTQSIRARVWRDQTVTLKVAARVEPLDSASHAYITLEGDVEIINPTYCQIADSLIGVEVVSKEWAVYELKAKVKSSAANIQVGLHFVGNGRAWFDSVSMVKPE